LTSWWSFGFGRVGEDAAEVSVSEPMAVAFEGDEIGVMDEPVDHGGGNDVVAEYLSHRPKALLLVTMRLARS
jgi:hypothetical protein